MRFEETPENGVVCHRPIDVLSALERFNEGRTVKLCPLRGIDGNGIRAIQPASAIVERHAILSCLEHFPDGEVFEVFADGDLQKWKIRRHILTKGPRNDTYVIVREDIHHPARNTGSVLASLRPDEVDLVDIDGEYLDGQGLVSDTNYSHFAVKVGREGANGPIPPSAGGQLIEHLKSKFPNIGSIVVAILPTQEAVVMMGFGSDNTEDLRCAGIYSIRVNAAIESFNTDPNVRLKVLLDSRGIPFGLPTPHTDRIIAKHPWLENIGNGTLCYWRTNNHGGKHEIMIRTGVSGGAQVSRNSIYSKNKTLSVLQSLFKSLHSQAGKRQAEQVQRAEPAKVQRIEKDTVDSLRQELLAKDFFISTLTRTILSMETAAKADRAKILELERELAKASGSTGGGAHAAPTRMAQDSRDRVGWSLASSL